MSTFDPDAPCRVHDKLNEKILDWRPERAANYRQYASGFDAGIINWDGCCWTAGVRCSDASETVGSATDAGRAFVKDMQAFHAAKTGFEKDEIAVRQLHALREFQRPGHKQIKITDVHRLFAAMKDHP